jgi:uncharacterized protein YhfF
MTIEQIRTLHRAKAFKPFTVHTVDGTSVEVTHPENMLQSQGRRTIIVNLQGEEMAIIDLLLVTKVSFAQTSRKRK